MLTSHVSELFTSTLEILAIFLLNRVLNSAWHWVVDAQNRALNKLDLPGLVTFQATCWLLALPPCVGRTRVTSIVR